MKCKIENVKCKRYVFAAQMILIVGFADTLILHFALCILHPLPKTAQQTEIFSPFHSSFFASKTTKRQTYYCAIHIILI